MTRVTDTLNDSPRLTNRIALMHIARKKTETLHACDVLSSALKTFRRIVVTFKSFAVHEKVLFHRFSHGWRQGTVAGIDSTTSNDEFEQKIYLTHSTRVHPFFGELSIPPTLLKDHLRHDPPDIPSSHLPNALLRRASISDPINQVFVSTHKPVEHALDLELIGTSYTLCIGRTSTMDIDSDLVHLTVTKVIKDPNSLFSSDRAPFDGAKKGEIDFLFKHAVTPNPVHDVPDTVQLQPLKWVLETKFASADEKKERHRARIVSVLQRSFLRHLVHGNTPTVMLSTVSMFTCIVPTWMQFHGDDKSMPSAVMSRRILCSVFIAKGSSFTCHSRNSSKRVHTLLTMYGVHMCKPMGK